jgi:hypothetical protein
MPDTNRRSGKFSNCREWRSFMTALQGAALSPKIVLSPKIRGAVSSSFCWSADAARTSNWLLAGGRFSPQRP